jgi:hypothetical protein
MAIENLRKLETYIITYFLNLNFSFGKKISIKIKTLENPSFGANL